MKTIYLQIPMPPSINAMYINRPKWQRGTGRILSDEARAFKDLVCLMTRSELDDEPSKESEYGLFIIMYVMPTNLRRDVSNIIKITEDAVFEGLGVDDSHNCLIHVEKQRANEERCDVWVGEIDAIRAMLIPG